MPARPTAVRTDKTNAFAHRSMAERVPGIIQDTIDHNPDYPASVRDALAALRDEIATDAPLRLFLPPAPDHDLWLPRFEPHRHETWLATEWLFAEMLLYRLMMDAARYWDSLRDPFAPFKEEELASEALWAGLDRAFAVTGTREDRLAALLTLTLWGNQVDLSLKHIAAQGMRGRDEHLLANDIPAVVAHLLGRPPGDVHVIADNAGTEQALDYALVDRLLDEGLVRRVTLHVKMHPVLVSDVVVPDVYRLLGRMKVRGGEAAALAGRLTGYLGAGRLRVVPDFFWNTPDRMWALPPRLQAALQGAQLVVLKGDANYRRATNDAIWPPGVAFSAALQRFPAPVLALRTLKSDTLVGVDAATVDRLDGEEDDWRTSGTYGVAHFAVFGGV